MMKRVVCLLVLCAMLVTLAACGGGGQQAGTTDATASTASGGQTELVFWLHLEEGWKASYESIVSDFMEENPDIVIKMEYFPYDEFETKVQTSLLAGQGGADLIEIWGGWGLDFARPGVMAEIPDSMSETIRNDSYPPTFGALEHDGKLYGMPMEFNIEFGGMLANLHLMEQHGYSAPATWDEMIDQAEGATVMDGDLMEVKGFDFTSWDTPTYLWTSMILSAGGEYWSEENGFNFTSKEAKDAFTVLSDLIIQDNVTDLTELTGGDDLEGYQLLYTDNALYVPRGPWVIAEGVNMFELTYDEDFTYLPMPTYNNGDKFAAETGWSLAVNGKSEKQDAAFRFLEYFFQDDVLLSHNIACGMVPPKKSIAHSPELVEALPFMAVPVAILDEAQFIGYFNTDRLKEAVNDAFMDYCGGVNTDMDAVLENMNNALNG